MTEKLAEQKNREFYEWLRTLVCVVVATVLLFTFVVRIVRFREAFLEEDNEGIAGFSESFGYLFFAFGNSGRDEDGAVSGIGEAFFFAGVYFG